jgi:uncharacterized protein YggE
MKLLRTLSLFLTMAAALPALSNAQSDAGTTLAINKENRTISVSASDHAEAEPEVADLHVGFTTYGATLQSAYKSASDTSNTVVKAMIDAGAPSSGIQSNSQRVARLDDFEIKTRKGMKFSVEQSWTVSVAPKEAALILDAAIQAGANQSGEINWRMKNSVALDTQAIMRATERAKAMAIGLAKAMEVNLGKPLYATNVVSGGAFVSAASLNNFVGGMRRSDAAPAPLAIESQRVERTATVQIVFSIE